MSLVEPGQDRTIGPDPVTPAQFDATPDPVVLSAEVTTPEADAPEPETFDREYVHGLREEAAGWRTKLREQEARFEGVDEETITALVEFARLSKAAESGDADALAQLNEMMGEDAPADPAPVQEFTEERFRQLAREEAERLVTEQSQAQQQEAAVRGIVTKAESLGYTQGSEDYILLMRAANAADPAEHQDVLAFADTQVKAYKQSILDAYLAEKETATDGSPQLTQPGAAPTTAKLPWDDTMTSKQRFEAVRHSLHERLNAAG